MFAASLLAILIIGTLLSRLVPTRWVMGESPPAVNSELTIGDNSVPCAANSGQKEPEPSCSRGIEGLRPDRPSCSRGEV